MSDEPGPKKRDSLGRWKKGVTGNPKGRPSRAKEKEYLDVIMDRVTPEILAQIAEKAVEQALEGDWKAREWVTKYTVGEPASVHEYLVDKTETYTLRVIFEGRETPRLESGESDDDVDGEWEVLEREEED